MATVSLVKRRIGILLLTFATIAAWAQQDKNSRAAALYENALNQMIGTSQNRDPIHGLDDLKESARLGYAPAQTAMFFYADSQDESAKYCRQAAEQGDALGQWCIGRAYYLGFGVPRDLSAAEQWLRKAADQGNPFAAYLVGSIKEERDPKAAPPWFRRAAEQGLPLAQQKLGLLYAEGQYLPHDKYLAYMWLLTADESGATTAHQESTLESDLGTTAVNRAKSEAREQAKKFSRTANAHGCTGWEGEFDPVAQLPPVRVQKFCR